MYVWRPRSLQSVFPHVCSNRSRNLSTLLILAIVVHKVTIWPKEVHYYCVIHLQESTLLSGEKKILHISQRQQQPRSIQLCIQLSNKTSCQQAKVRSGKLYHHLIGLLLFYLTEQMPPWHSGCMKELCMQTDPHQAVAVLPQHTEGWENMGQAQAGGLSPSLFPVSYKFS